MLTKEQHKRKYDAYIGGPAWVKKKKQFYSNMPKTCLACGSVKDIHLHHHTYDRLFAERLSDLVPLCEGCHFEVHRLHDLEEKRSLSYVTFAYIASKSKLDKPLTASNYNPKKQKRDSCPKGPELKRTRSKENLGSKKKEAPAAKRIKVCVYCKSRTNSDKNKLYFLRKHGTYLHKLCKDEILKTGV